MNGGYQIIDLKDNNFITNGDAIIIEGIYEAIEGTNRKAILLSGITVDGVEKNDEFTPKTVNDSKIILKSVNGDFEIESNDNVTLTDK